MTTVDLLFAAVVLLAAVSFGALLLANYYREALEAAEWCNDVGPDANGQDVYSCPACGSLMRDGKHAAGCPIAAALEREVTEC